MHYPGVTHYPVVYQSEQSYPSVHTDFYQEDAISSGHYPPRSYVPYVDPSAGPSFQGAATSRWQMLPYTHRMHAMPSPSHAPNYHSLMMNVPSGSYNHHGYYLGHQPIIASQAALSGHHQVGEAFPEPHYT